MTFKTLDTVVLVRDLPKHGLKAGDPGAVVEVYHPDAVDVECVTASGRTTALLYLKAVDVRLIRDSDLFGGGGRSVGLKLCVEVRGFGRASAVVRPPNHAAAQMPLCRAGPHHPHPRPPPAVSSAASATVDEIAVTGPIIRLRLPMRHGSRTRYACWRARA